MTLPITRVALAASLLAGVATAQSTAQPTEFTASPTRLLADWRADHGDSWRLLTNQRTGTVEMLFGGRANSPFEPDTNEPAAWFTLARYWVEQTYQMHGVESDQLVEERFRFMPLGQVNSTDKITVRFEQVVNGVPVEDGAVNVLFDTSGRLLSVHSTAAPTLTHPGGKPTTGAGFATLVAARAFKDEFGVQPNQMGEARLVHAHSERGEVKTWDLAWEIDATFDNGEDQPLGRRYSIDATGRDVLKSENTIHNFDVFGTIRANATPGLTADRAANPPTPIAMPRTRITSSAGTVETDRDGNFNITGVNTPIDLTVDYFGEFTNVNNDTGADYSITFQGVQPNQQNDLLMNPSPSQTLTSQANAQLHINVLRDYIRDTFPTDPTADFRATANVNLSSNCNAFFNGSSTNYYTAGGGCNNTAFSTVVAHEMGHWLNQRYGTGNGNDGMGEGNADVFAMYCYDDSVVGRFFTTGGGSVRNGTNTRQFCGDNNSGCYSGVHANGEVWMGAAWKVRVNLNTSLGNAAGDMAADSLFLGWLNSYNQTQIRSIIETQWLTLDDDDGNINNGTPNYAAIDQGFTAQGFPGVELELITISDVTALGDTPDEAGPYVVEADIISNFGGALTGAELRYRVNGVGGFISTPMINTVGDTFAAGIPGQISPSRVEYYVNATESGGTDKSFPEGGESSPLTFRIGDITPIIVTEFEAGADGFVGGAPGDTATTGQWTLGNPIGTAAQSEDDHTAVGVNCWFTGQGSPGGSLGENDVDGGITTLLSPVFDASGLNSVEVSYWRWYSNTTGASPNADIFEVEVSADGGATWVDVETVGPTGAGTDGGWIQASFELASIVTPTSSMQLRFIASDLGNGSIVEAAIDDIEIVGLGSSIPDPVRYCTANPNSTGLATRIDFNGSVRISEDSFFLTASNMPRSSFGLFFFGDQQVQTPISGSQGILCVGGTQFRLPPVQADALLGIAFYQVDFTSPSTNGQQILGGSTWNFQMWHRDASGGQVTSNTSDALQISFGD
ncbi:MAG: hypothetical protein ISQ11_05805 [Planctomycetes bacterium]|nr:hypothetical protein [Planctomycetota bacterium]